MFGSVPRSWIYRFRLFGRSRKVGLVLAAAEHQIHMEFPRVDIPLASSPGVVPGPGITPDMTTGKAFYCDKLVRFQHCDPAGIVFYPQYFVLFHEVLEDRFNDGLGVDYAGFIGIERLGIPTVSIQCQFIAPSKHGETVRFGLRVRATDCLVGHHHPALEQQLLDIVQAQVEAEIPANGAADYTRGEAVTLVKRLRLLHRLILTPPAR